MRKSLQDYGNRLRLLSVLLHKHKEGGKGHDPTIVSWGFWLTFIIYFLALLCLLTIIFFSDRAERGYFLLQSALGPFIHSWGFTRTVQTAPFFFFFFLAPPPAADLSCSAAAC